MTIHPQIDRSAVCYAVAMVIGDARPAVSSGSLLASTSF